MEIGPIKSQLKKPKHFKHVDQNQIKYGLFGTLTNNVIQIIQTQQRSVVNDGIEFMAALE